MKSLNLAVNIGLVICIIGFVGYILADQTYHMLSFGSVLIPAVDTKVYSDSACQNECTYIDWGNMQPNTTTSRLVYIKNMGGRAVTLNITATDWNPPEASEQLTLSWNYTGVLIQPEQVIPVTLTMTVAPYSTVETFSHNIVITSTWS